MRKPPIVMNSKHNASCTYLTKHMMWFDWILQPYTAASADKPASHQNLLRMYYQVSQRGENYFLTNLCPDWGPGWRIWCAQMCRGESKPDRVHTYLVNVSSVWYMSTSNTGNTLLNVHPWDHCTLHCCRHGAEMWYQEKPELLGRRLRQNPPGDID